MTKTAPGPKELALRAQREEKAAKPKRLVPFAGADKPVRGGRYSPNRPKPKEKTNVQT